MTADGATLAWAQSTGSQMQMWTLDLQHSAAPALLTTDTGSAVLNGAPDDLVIGAGRLYWTATPADDGNSTEVRSVALTGGPVTVHKQPGSWQLTTWPWLVNGADSPRGTTALDNLSTGQVVTVSGGDLETVHCTPAWCLVVSVSDGAYRVEVRHPDGTASQTVASGQIVPTIADIVALNRFVVLSEAAAYSDLTGTRQILVFDLSTQHTINLSAAARTVSYSNGVLWWSTGTQASPVWHAVDLRTV
jgi:hypothetical protein